MMMNANITYDSSYFAEEIFATDYKDIALSIEKQKGTTIQNQIQGTVSKIIKNCEGVFCIVDCGFEIFVEISQGIIQNLYLHEGQEIYCQIKANDFDVVHVFDEKKEYKKVTVQYAKL